MKTVRVVNISTLREKITPMNLKNQPMRLNFL